MEAAEGMIRRDLILYETEIKKINDQCTCGMEREPSLEYVTLESSRESSPVQDNNIPLQTIQAALVCV